jgi:uncharacterized protein YdeI (YjbR/CyaY-like superfamily)
MKELPIVEFSSQQAWQEWLDDNHESSPGVSIKMAKKASGIASITHAEALEVALMYGWIDGRATAVDERYFTQWFLPRRRGSRWSKINRDTAERLIAESRMAPAGLREIESARANGNWDAAYDGPSTIAVPDDLQAVLDRNDVAATFFAALDSRNRYAILYRLQEAKRPETRARRLEKFVAMLDAGEKLYP